MIDTAMTYNGASTVASIDTATSSDELKCPKCFARASNDINSILNPQLAAVRFVYSTKCPHYLCVNCKNELYRGATSLNKQLKCFSCQTFLRAGDYTEQTIEEYQFDRDFKIRQTLMKIYNKKRQDFPTLNEYNAYLEDVEDKIQKLIDQEDVELIQRQIKEYQMKNRQQIAVANLKKEEQLRALELMIKAENQRLNLYGYSAAASQLDNMDPLTRERVSKLLQNFKLDDLDKLGEAQSQVVHETEQLDASTARDPLSSSTGQQQQQQPRFVEPYIYTLYRTDMPRCLEQTRIPSNNVLAQIIASGGLLRSNAIKDLQINSGSGGGDAISTIVPPNYKMIDLHREKQNRLFRSGLI